jgi:cobalt-zinc-cadmium efflux system protein
MDHAHNHDHAHSHVPAPGAGNERRIFWALLITAGFMVVEVLGGVFSGSLALLADAGHMLTDTASLALAWAAVLVAKRPHDARRSYGYHRFQVLAAFVNGVALIAIVVWIAVEAALRIMDPVKVLGTPMLAVAVTGLLVNLVAYGILHRGAKENINVQGAVLHVLGDLLGSVAAIVAALVILWTGWLPIDPILSLFVALLVLRSAWFLTRRSAHILLEGSPEWLDEAALKSGLIEAVPEVVSVHHVHAWMLTPERPLVTLHADVREGADHHAVLEAITGYLKANYDIGHATIQIEAGPCPDEVHHAAVGRMRTAS